MGLEQELRNHMKRAQEAKEQRLEAERLAAEAKRGELDRFAKFVSEIREETDLVILPLLETVNKIVANDSGKIKVENAKTKFEYQDFINAGKYLAVSYRLGWGRGYTYINEIPAGLHGEAIYVFVIGKEDRLVMRIFGGDRENWQKAGINEFDFRKSDFKDKAGKAILKLIETGHTGYHESLDEPDY